MLNDNKYIIIDDIYSNINIRKTIQVVIIYAKSVPKMLKYNDWKNNDNDSAKAGSGKIKKATGRYINPMYSDAMGVDSMSIYSKK